MCAWLMPMFWLSEMSSASRYTYQYLLLLFHISWFLCYRQQNVCYLLILFNTCCYTSGERCKKTSMIQHIKRGKTKLQWSDFCFVVSDFLQKSMKLKGKSFTEKLCSVHRFHLVLVVCPLKHYSDQLMLKKKISKLESTWNW